MRCGPIWDESYSRQSRRRHDLAEKAPMYRVKSLNLAFRARHQGRGSNYLKTWPKRSSEGLANHIKP